MTAKQGTGSKPLGLALFGFKLLTLAIIMVAAGWLVWKGLPPYTPGNHAVEADSVAAAEAGPSSKVPKIGNCEIFPPDNVWNTPIDNVKTDPNGTAYIANIGPSAKLHPDFGSSFQGGIPFTEIAPLTKRVAVKFEYAEDSDLGNYPIPPNAPIEGGPASTGDRHILLIDRARCLLYELFDAQPKPDGTWTAGAGIRMDLTDNALRPDGKTSADAAGLPILPGLVRYDEIAAGEIDHALRFTIPHTQAAYIWPARHKASRIADPKVAPMGVRLRLRAGFDISHYSKTNQIILTALKRYGMFLADNGGAMFFSGVPDKRWDDEDLHHLMDVTAADFEVVDESDLQMLADSARVDPLAIVH